MEIIVFLSIVIAVVAVLTSIVLVRRVKKQIAEMTDVLVDVKNGNGNRRILSATKVRNCGHENGAVCPFVGGWVQNQTRTTRQLQQTAPAVVGHRQQFESVDPRCKCDRPSKCFAVGQSAKPTGRYARPSRSPPRRRARHGQVGQRPQTKHQVPQH